VAGFVFADKTLHPCIIFAGSPNWFGTPASCVATFLSETDLSGKTVVLSVLMEGVVKHMY
jgi:hypothetical protein